jgi:hypothetical protein
MEGTTCSDHNGTLCNGKGACTVPSCTDGIVDGTETDVDCGGDVCPKCADGKKCNIAMDCADGVCSGTPKTCQAPTCTDGVKNGLETDVDCGGGSYMGGAPCPRCSLGRTCTAASDCVAQSCQGTCVCPMGMTEATIPGASSYCIDATEVTYGQYLTFYNANFPFSTQPPYCSWNNDWTPKSPQITPLAVPVAVNWCQAEAYCRNHTPSLHLCGQVGGGSVPQASFMDPDLDQWFNACSQHGNFSYPYGAAYDPTKCNGSQSVDGGSLGPGLAATWPMCGPMTLLDMSGNVAEWEDSCSGTTGATDTCAIRGGSYLDGAGPLRCDSGQTAGPITKPRNYDNAALDVGFRCCL